MRLFNKIRNVPIKRLYIRQMSWAQTKVERQKKNLINRKNPKKTNKEKILNKRKKNQK